MERLKRRRIKKSRLKEALQYNGRTGEREGEQEQIQLICHGVGDALEEKRSRRRIGFVAFLKRQVRFISWKIWFMQGVMLMILCAVMESWFGGLYGKNSNIRFAAFFLCCLSILIMLSAAPVFYRSVRYKMYEIELSTRFCAVKIIIAKVLAIGIGNVVLLGAILLLTTMKTALRVESALLYLLLSYLTASGGFLYLLGHIPVEKLQIGSAGLGCALFWVLLLLKRFCPEFFAQTFSVGWGAVCLVLFLFCIRQFCYLICQSGYAQV